MPRTRSLSIFGLIAFALTSYLIGQQPATPNSILTTAATGMGGTNLQAISLTGTAESSTGSNDDTG